MTDRETFFENGTEFGIICTDEPDRKTLKKLASLTDSVNASDGLHYSVPDDGDLCAFVFDKERLLSAAVLYFMGDEYNGKPVVEVSAFTEPGYRKRGLFKKALDTLLLQADKDGKFAVRFAVYGNAAAYGTLSSLKAVHGHDELILEKHPDAEDVSDQSIGHCGKDSEQDAGRITVKDGMAYSDFSECGFKVYGDSAYIFGVLTYDRFLHQGHAGHLLTELIKKLFCDGIKAVSLEVSENNVPALGLYKKLGFKEKDRIEYYYLQS